MNKLHHHVIWNRARACFMVVGENARRVTKASGGASVSRSRGRSRSNLVGAAVALAVLQMAGPAIAQTPTVILPNGMTDTAVTGSRGVFDVRTGTLIGRNAFNAFSAFSVGAGDTVNLQVPGAAANLINIVQGARTDIHGVLNAYKDGAIGGNVWFANAQGFVVGATGVVNVGALSVATPSLSFIEGFFAAPGAPNEAAVTQLLAGQAPRNATATIAIDGQVNAIDGISLSAGTISVGGALYAGARFVGTSPEFTDVVNVNGLGSASRMVLRHGRIEIVADGRVDIDGTVASQGGTGVDGGQVEIRAGGDVTLAAGARVSVRGEGANSSGGSVTVWSDQDAHLRAGAGIDASAGTTGDGGFIEFSARKTVHLAGGTLEASAVGGEGGRVLIDPTSIQWTGAAQDVFTNGASYALVATESIVLDDVVVSTRKVDSPNRASSESGGSTGNSGDLLLQAPSITLTNSKLLSFADNTHAGGRITLDAADSGLLGGTSTITVRNSTLKGHDIDLKAGVTFASTLLPAAVAVNRSAIDIDASTLDASGHLDVSATSRVDIGMFKLSPLALSEVVSDAKVTISGASVIRTAGDTTLRASSNVKTSARSGLPDIVELPADAAVVDTTVVSNAAVVVKGTAAIDATGALALAADNATTVNAEANATGDGVAAVGGTAAVSVVTATTEARLSEQARVTRAASIRMTADATHALTTTAVAAAGGTDEKGPSASGVLQSFTEQVLKDHEAEVSTTDGAVGVAAAVGVSVLTTTTQAVIDTTGVVHTDGSLALHSTALNSADVTADGTSATGGIGAAQAVGVNVGVVSNDARIADNARVEARGVTLEATNPDGGVNGFHTRATSGAGATNVGVAGAMGVNVLVDVTRARIEGDLDTDDNVVGANVAAAGGDVRVQARSASQSTLDVGADRVPDGDSALVGVGASIGTNVGTHVTLAEIGNQASLTGARDVTLLADGDHTLTNAVTGGAAGASVTVTPVAAVSVGVNTTIARLGTGDALTHTGAFRSEARQRAETTTEATGQTEGKNVSVGASLAANVAVDVVTSTVERDLSADQSVSLLADAVASSRAGATASVAGGSKADENGQATNEDGSAGKSVDEQIGALLAEAVKKGSDKDKDSEAAGSFQQNQQDAPKAETSEGGVSVAAAVGVNVGTATTVASVADGTALTSGGTLTVDTRAETDAQAHADGSQVDAGGTQVGVGAAVALNVGVATHLAVIGDEARIRARGITVRAVTPDGARNDFGADATSGAGASEVGVAGALAVNVVFDGNRAYLESDEDRDGRTASLDAGGGNVGIEARGASASTVSAKADLSADGAKAGIGVSVGLNVGVNLTQAEVGDQVSLSGAGDVGLKAEGDHALSTTVEGGAAGAQVAVTPVAATTIAVNTTQARLGTGSTLTQTGALRAEAAHQASATTEAKGQTQGDKLAVGTSLALNVATDVVTASIERNVDAGQGVDVLAASTASSSASATASVAGGHKADADDKPTGGAGGAPGQTVDEQVDAQKGAADKAGRNANSQVGDSLDQNPKDAPKAETSEGGVSVAAAVGVNIGTATTVASVADGTDLKSGGVLNVASSAETDAQAQADGRQQDAGGTRLGVGAAVALNVGVGTTVALIGDEARVQARGITLSAVTPDGVTNDLGAQATSGAGASEVGVAGALAVNVGVLTHVAALEGDEDRDGQTASVDARGGDVSLKAHGASGTEVRAEADVSADGAKAGVGASLGVNVMVNTTTAEVQDQVLLTGARDLALHASAAHEDSLTVKGGAAGAKVSVTPLVGVHVSVDTTTARLGTLGSAQGALSASGDIRLAATQTHRVSNEVSGLAVGDVAVGASLAGTVAVDQATASLERDVAASTGIDLDATSGTSLQTTVKAGAKGAKEVLDKDGKQQAGTSVDEQKDQQLRFAADKNGSTRSADLSMPEAKTPDTATDEKGGSKQQGKKVSVAAAIGVAVAQNQAVAQVGTGRTLATSGDLSVGAQTDTNYATLATGEAVSDEVGVAAAVALTATRNVTRANLGAGSTVTRADDITISAHARQNRGDDFREVLAAEAVSGAGGGDVAVAGALAIVANDNQTRAAIDEGATVGSAADPVGDVRLDAQDTSKIGALARAGALSTGRDSKAGIGASFAVLLSNNVTTASLGYESGAYGATRLFADSLSLNAAKNRVSFNSPADVVDFSRLVDPINADPLDKDNYVAGIEDFAFDTLDPTHYLGANNYYTEAVAGAVAKGQAAVAGAFSVNLFRNLTQAAVENGVQVTTYGNTGTADLRGVDVSSRSDTQAIAFGGAVAGAKKAGVGVTVTDLSNLDEVLASIGDTAQVEAKGTGNGVRVSADGQQIVAAIGVSATAAQENAALSGVLSVNLALNKAQARIGDGAIVRSQGHVAVDAASTSTLVNIAGGVAGGKEVGVGGAIGANILGSVTEARIGDNALVNAKGATRVKAEADEVLVAAVVAGAGAGKVGLAGALGINTVLTVTEAAIGQGAQVNTDAAFDSADQTVDIAADDSTVVVGVAGGGAGGGKVGVGAALGTNVLAKTVRAYIADDTVADGRQAQVDAVKRVSLDAAASEVQVSLTAGFAGGGNAGVGGAVGLGIVKNDIRAYVGQQAGVDTDGNLLVNAQDDHIALLLAGSGAGGGDAGVGGSVAGVVFVGNTEAFIAEGAVVNARGNRDTDLVYSGDTVVSTQPEKPDTTPGALLDKPQVAMKGVAVTAYNRESLVALAASGAGGGKAGVAGSVGVNVIANNTAAYIDKGAKVNESNAAAGSEQQVRVAAVNEALVLNGAGAGAGGGQAGVAAGGSMDAITRTTRAWIGEGARVTAKDAVRVDAAAAALSFTTSIGGAGGGQAGVGGAVSALVVADTTEALIQDADTAAQAAQVDVTGGDLAVQATHIATTWQVAGAGAGGGTAGVGGSLAVAVNASTTRARIGDHAQTNAAGTTAVTADAIENHNNAVVAGAGGGSAGVGGSVGLTAVSAVTEASIGDHARVNQGFAGEDVKVEATDKIITVAIGGAGAGGGAAGVGGTAEVTLALNTTSAYIGTSAIVDATRDVQVSASSDKYVNSLTIAGAGGGSAGVAGAVNILSVGSLLDGEAKSGVGDGATGTYADGQTTKSPVGDVLGDSAEAVQVKSVVDNAATNIGIGKFLGDSAPVPLKNTQAFIAGGADVQAGRDVSVTAHDASLALMGSGAGAGGGAAGVAGALGVVLMHNSAEAFIGDGAQVDADRHLRVAADTRDDVVNINITGGGGGAAEVTGGATFNIVSSDTAAHVNAAALNQRTSSSTEQAVSVTADSRSILASVAGNGGGAGAAAVGGVVDVNVLTKRTKAYIGQGAVVAADTDVQVAADSTQVLIGGGVAIRGAGAAAVGAVGGTNVVANTTEAFIGAAREDADKRRGAVVDSDGNVRLSATDDSLVIAMAAAGNGAGAAGVGATAAANVISSQTRAYVSDNSVVNARGNAAGTDVYDGTIDNLLKNPVPPLPGGPIDVDINRDGRTDGTINSNLSFTISAQDADGSTSASQTFDPAGELIQGVQHAAAEGGLGSRGVESGVKGLSVVAVGSEKIVSGTLGVAGAGAAAVTGAASANLVISETEARIGDGVTVNASATGGADPSVRVRAADNTLIVQTTATFTGAGAVSVSGSADTGIVAKKTTAHIGDADVKARDVVVEALASEDLYTITGNIAGAGGGGIGGAVGVDVVANQTRASIGAGADIQATRDISVRAAQDTSVNLFALSGAGGAAAGVSGALTVGVIANTTEAEVEDADDPANAARLDAAGTTAIEAQGQERILSGTISAAAGGGAGIAGALGVKVVASTTRARIGDHSQINQRTSGAAQDVVVKATDEVTLNGAGGSLGLSIYSAVGATADINIVRTTTSASLGEEVAAHAGRDLTVAAVSTKNVQSAALAASGGLGVGIGGAVSLAVVGASLDAQSQASIRDANGGGNSADYADGKMKENNVTGQLGDSEHVQGTQAQVAGEFAKLGVADDINAAGSASQDKTQAFIGAGSQVTTGRDVNLGARDALELDLLATGASGAIAGIGAAVGVGIVNATTESFVDGGANVKAGGDVRIQAQAVNQDADGAQVRVAAGGGGVIGASAAVAVVDDTSTTQAYLGAGSQVDQADELKVLAATDRLAKAESLGASAGALAVGASVASASFDGSTRAYVGRGAGVGQGSLNTVGSLQVGASDQSQAVAHAVAGTAGVVAGSGAVATATMGATVEAALDDDVDVTAQRGVTVAATATPTTEASALGVNIGAGAVGASVATAKSAATTRAMLGDGVHVEATTLDVLASRTVGSGPSALAQATGAAGGLLLGANATAATAEGSGETRAQVGEDSDLEVSGTTTVKADSASQQTSSGLGLSTGTVAAGADFSLAKSDTATLALLGDGVQVTGNALQVLAASGDTNFAYGVAGSGGVASAPFSYASTTNTSLTHAATGSGDAAAGATRKIDVARFLVDARHTANFDSWLVNTNASLVGVSGAQTTHTLDATTQARVGTSGIVEADEITLNAHNDVFKASPGTIPGLSNARGGALAAPSWNVDSSSGGLADVPAAGSQTFLAADAQVEVGAGARLTQTGSGQPGAFELDAWNDIHAQDRARLSSGGAISAASAASEIRPVEGKDSARSLVRVGVLAELDSRGDLKLGARSDADLKAQAAVDVYGLVGVAPFGASTAQFTSTNRIEIGTGARLEAGLDVLMSAGGSTDSTLNDIAVLARTDVYNNTAIPVNRDPVADALVETRSQIEIGTGADVGAARNIYLYAQDGTATAQGVGIGKDVYREALAEVASAVSEAFGGGEVSFETRTGRSARQQRSEVRVDGTVHTGTQRHQELVIGEDGSVVSSTGDITIADTGFRDVAGDIQQRINDLYKLIGDYTVDEANSDAAIAVAAYKSEINFLQRKLKEMGFATGEVAGSNVSARQAAQDAVTGMKTKVTGYEDDQTDLNKANADLRQDNADLGTENTRLAGENTTLNLQISDWEAQRRALDPNAPDYQAEYNRLTALIDPAQDTVTANEQTIAGNERTIIANRSTIDANTARITALDDDILQLNNQIADVEADLRAGVYSDQPAAGPVATFLTLSDATALLGNIYVRGDQLDGQGTLDAPGDAQISILNQGPNFLILKNLTIAPDLGGSIFFNGVDVRSNDDINQVNGQAGRAAFGQVKTAGSSTTPTILVQSTYDPLADPNYGRPNTPQPRPAPDIVLQGDISNLRGLVKIDTAAGSIRIEQKRDANGNLIQPVETASVRADQVQIETRNGDFVQSYTNSFFDTAGDPLTVVKGDPNLTPVTNPNRLDRIEYTPETAGAGIVANGSVLIAARYLNVNGVIQSGIDQWGVTVPVGAQARLPDNSTVSFAQAKRFYDALTPLQKAASGAEYFDVTDTTLAGLAGSDWRKITVRYNAKADRLELGGVQVQGGYISLFGQIYNTNAAGGELRVLDGYGTIQVDNQTTLPLLINALDTGRGVTGQIDITNITGLDTQGNPVTATTTYTRTPGGSRDGGAFNPAAGLRYAKQVGSTSGRVDNYRYSSGAIIGIEVFPTELDRYFVSGQTLDNDPIPNNGQFLGLLPAQHAGQSKEVTENYTRSGRPATTASWFECNWLTLCIVGTYYKEFNIQSSTKSITTTSVKADHAIGIRYIGVDHGVVDVKSAGNLLVNGSIVNRDGDTTLSAAGVIDQNGDLPLVWGNNVTLAAGAGIGASGQALQVKVNGGKLDATADSGDVRVSQLLGDLRVGQVGGAGVANVFLETDRSLVNFDGASVVQGQRVELVSRNGGIGTLTNGASEPLNVRTGYTSHQSQWPNHGLMATARDSIHIRNDADPAHAATYSGNLLLIAAESLAGDVRIETTGSVIDNNPFATTDTRSQAELAQLWDDLRLRGQGAQDKADEAVVAYAQGKEANYQLYWQLRQRQADGGAAYDPGYQFVFTPTERSALLATGLDDTQIATLAANRTAQYHALDAEVGHLTGAFVGGYRYDVSDAEKAGITQGARWSDAQLELSVGAGLLKAITDTVTTIKEPNAKGRSVTLIAGGDVGSFDPVQTIDLSQGLQALTVAQKAALAAAERGDASLSGQIVTILQPRPVNVSVGAGALDVTAHGDVFIGSEQDLRIHQVQAAGQGDIRIKTAGALINGAAPGTANFTGASLILEAANGGIGAEDAPMLLGLAGPTGVIARAAGDLWLVSPQDLWVDTLYSRQDIHLQAAGSILDAQADGASLSPGLNLLAGNLWLEALAGSIGSATDALDMGVARGGLIHASATTVGQGVWLNGTAGEFFHIGSVTSGDAAFLSSATEMTIDGSVAAPGPIALVAGGALTFTANADVHATVLGVTLRAGELTMADGARLAVDVGTLDITTTGDATVTGITSGNGSESAVRITSSDGRILAGHALGSGHIDITADTAPAAKLTLWAARGIGDEPLNVKVLNFEGTSGGIADLAFQGDVRIDGLTAGDRILLSATGDIVGGNVTSNGVGGFHADKSLSVTSGGSIDLVRVSGQGDVGVVAARHVRLQAAEAGGLLQLDAGGDIDVDRIDGQGPVGMVTTGNLATGQVSALGDVTFRADQQVRFGAVASGGSVDIEAGQDVTGGSVASAGGAASTVRIAAPAGRLAIDSIVGEGAVQLEAALDIVVGQLLAGGPVTLDAGRNIGLGDAVGQDLVTLLAGDSVQAMQLTAGGDLSVLAARNIGLQTLESGGRLRLDAGGDIDVDQVDGQGPVGMAAVGNLVAGQVSTQGDVDFEAGQQVRFGTVASGGSLDIEAGQDVAGGSVASAGGLASTVRIAAPTGRLAIDSIAGEGAVQLDAALDIVVGRLLAGGPLQLDAGGDIDVDQTDGLGSVSMVAAGNLAAGQVSTEGDVAFRAGQQIRFGTVASGGSVDIEAGQDVTGGSVASAGGLASTVRIAAPTGRLAIDSIVGEGAVQLDAALDIVVGRLLAGGPLQLDAGGDIDIEQTDGQGSVRMVAVGNLAADQVNAVGDAAFRAGQQVRFGTVASGGSVDIEAGQDVTGGSVASAGGLASTLRIAAPAGRLAIDSIAGEGPVQLDAALDIDVGHLLAGGAMTLDAGGNIALGEIVGQDLVTLRARDSVQAGQVTAEGDLSVFAPVAIGLDQASLGADVFLFSEQIRFDIQGTGPDPVGGRIGGFDGGSSSVVQGSFTAPAGVRLDALSVLNGDLTMVEGDLRIDALSVGHRMTIANPQTDLLIDQASRAIQPVDVQLYTGGTTFTLDLITNHVYTDAWVVDHGPRHETLALNGDPNRSAAAQSAGVQAAVEAIRPRDAQDPVEASGLVTVDGIAVDLRPDKPGCDKKENPECKQVSRLSAPWLAWPSAPSRHALLQWTHRLPVSTLAPCSSSASTKRPCDGFANGWSAGPTPTP